MSAENIIEIGYPIWERGWTEEFKEAYQYGYRVRLVAANEYVFLIRPLDPARGIECTSEVLEQGRDILLRDICRVAPHILRLDADLAEAYDDAFRTEPRKLDIEQVAVFRARYAGRIEEIDGSLDGFSLS